MDYQTWGTLWSIHPIPDTVPIRDNIRSVQKMSFESRGSAYRKYLGIGISLIMVSSVLSIVVVGLPGVHAQSSQFGLDGSASNGCGYVTTCSLSLTTAQSNDVIIVGCDCFQSGTTFSVTDSAGLTFTPRESQLSIGGGQFVQTWYAISTSPLSSDTISVTTAETGETWYGVVAFAVSGANTVKPFLGLPESQANINCASPCNTGVSAAAGSFVFQVGGDTGSTLQTAGTGMTLIQATRSGQDAYAQYQVLSSALSSATLSFGSKQGSDFGVIVDAINPSASITTSSSSSSSTSSTTTGSPLDGSSLAFDKTGSSPTITLTTVHANDVVILLIAPSNTPGYVTVSSVTASGLSFSERQIVRTFYSGAWYDYEEWWALASSPLSAVVITAHLSGAPYFDTQLIAFGVNGALNPASPFDPNSGLPVTGTGTNCYTGCSLSISTTISNDLIFGGWIGGGNAAAGAGFTLIQSDGWYDTGPCPPGSCFLDSAADYSVVSSTQSSLSVGFTSSEHTQHWLMMADAIVLTA
jgi:hypothetical protein